MVFKPHRAAIERRDLYAPGGTGESGRGDKGFKLLLQSFEGVQTRS